MTDQTGSLNRQQGWTQSNNTNDDDDNHNHDHHHDDDNHNDNSNSNNNRLNQWRHHRHHHHHKSKDNKIKHKGRKTCVIKTIYHTVFAHHLDQKNRSWKKTYNAKCWTFPLPSWNNIAWLYVGHSGMTRALIETCKDALWMHLALAAWNQTFEQHEATFWSRARSHRSPLAYILRLHHRECGRVPLLAKEHCCHIMFPMLEFWT